jgi:hypothetical protein
VAGDDASTAQIEGAHSVWGQRAKSARRWSYGGLEHALSRASPSQGASAERVRERLHAGLRVGDRDGTTREREGEKGGETVKNR